MESKGEAFRAHPPPPSISSLPFPAHVSRASATAIQSEPRPPEGGPASRQTKASARESCGCPRTRQARAQLILRKREKLSLPTRTPARPSFATGLSISVSLSVSPLRPFVRPASVHPPRPFIFLTSREMSAEPEPDELFAVSPALCCPILTHSQSENALATRCNIIQ